MSAPQRPAWAVALGCGLGLWPWVVALGGGRCRDDSDGRALLRTVDAMTVLGDTKELLKASADAAAAEEEAEAEEEADSK